MPPTKHYYLKLPEDFFKQDKIAILENSKNGFLFSNILLKLYLLSLKNNGELLLSEDVPYTSEMIAHLTGQKHPLIEQAIQRYKELDLLIETENSTYKMANFQLLQGSILNESVRKQAYRNKEKVGQEQDKKTLLSQVGDEVVTDLSPEKDEVVTDLSQPKDGEIPKETDKTQTKGQINDEQATESSYTPFSIVPPKRTPKQVEIVPENLVTPTRKLLKPPKGGRPKKSEGNSHIENEKETPTTPE